MIFQNCLYKLVFKNCFKLLKNFVIYTNWKYESGLFITFFKKTLSLCCILIRIIPVNLNEAVHDTSVKF